MNLFTAFVRDKNFEVMSSLLCARIKKQENVMVK